jgi:hypothetical protein
MKAKVKFLLEIVVSIETVKDEKDTSVLELDLKASNLGNCLFDTLKNTKTHTLLNDKINNDYKANICGIKVLEERKLII